MQLLSIVSKHLSIPDHACMSTSQMQHDLSSLRKSVFIGITGDYKIYRILNFKLPERRLRINESPIAINLKKNVLENSKTVDAKYYLKFSTNFKSSDHLV